MSATHISLEHAKSDKLFYFVANAVVYRKEDGRCLILKRHSREKVHPSKWAVLGGKLERSQMDVSKPTRVHGDVLDYENILEDLLKREVEEEAGIQIDTSDLRYINSIGYIRPDGVPTMFIKVACQYAGGDVKIDEHDFEDYAWVNGEEVEKYDCLLGVPEEVRKAITIFL